MPPVAVKVALTAIILAWGLAGLLWKPRRSLDPRIAATIVVATFAFVETVTYAHFKVDGSHTWTYPIPFVSWSSSLPSPRFGSGPGACTDQALDSDVDGVSGWLPAGGLVRFFTPC
jgi:hypothetical protein